MAGILDAVKNLVKPLVAPLVWPVQQLRGEAAGDPLLAVLLLVALLMSAVRAVRGSLVAALALVPLSLAWAIFNGPLEGPTLFVLTSSHGVTASDLIALTGLMISAWRLVPALARH